MHISTLKTANLRYALISIYSLALRSLIYVQDEFVIVATFFSQCRKIVVSSKLIMASNFLLIEVEGMITDKLMNHLLGAKSESVIKILTPRCENFLYVITPISHMA